MTRPLPCFTRSLNDKLRSKLESAADTYAAIGDAYQKANESVKAMDAAARDIERHGGGGGSSPPLETFLTAASRARCCAFESLETGRGRRDARERGCESGGRTLVGSEAR